MSTNLDKPDATMNKLNSIADMKLASFIWAFIIMVPVPWLLVKGNTLGWLALLMGLGPILAGLWLFATMRLRARKSKKSPLKATYQRKAANEWVIKSLAVGLVLGLVAGLVVVVTGNSLVGYNLVKSLGFWTYAIIGLAPVVAYAWMTYRLLNRRKLGWTIALGLVSLLAPWFWASYLAWTINP